MSAAEPPEPPVFPRRPDRMLGRRAAIAAVLLVAGVALLAGFRIASGSQHQAFASGALPPAGAHVTSGRTYQLVLPGGVAALKRRGVQTTSAECQWSAGGGPGQVLSATVEGADTKATNTVATFVAPVTATITVECAGWGPMFIDDADNAPADTGGWLLVLAIAALAVGAGLGVSALREASALAAAASSASRRAGDDDEVEGRIEVFAAAPHDEVPDADGGDGRP